MFPIDCLSLDSLLVSLWCLSSVHSLPDMEETQFHCSQPSEYHQICKYGFLHWIIGTNLHHLAITCTCLLFSQILGSLLIVLLAINLFYRIYDSKQGLAPMFPAYLVDPVINILAMVSWYSVSAHYLC